MSNFGVSKFLGECLEIRALLDFHHGYVTCDLWTSKKFIEIYAIIKEIRIERNKTQAQSETATSTSYAFTLERY